MNEVREEHLEKHTPRYIKRTEFFDAFEEMNKYFLSGNDCPRDSHVKIKRADWEHLYSLLSAIK